MASKTLNNEDLTVGMELAEPVLNHYGQMLLSVGTVLMENHIKLFKTWGIRSVIIKTEETVVPADLTKALDFETMAILKRRMNWTPMNDHEADLFNLAIQIISKPKQ